MTAPVGFMELSTGDRCTSDGADAHRSSRLPGRDRSRLVLWVRVRWVDGARGRAVAGAQGRALRGLLRRLAEQERAELADDGMTGRGQP